MPFLAVVLGEVNEDVDRPPEGVLNKCLYGEAPPRGTYLITYLFHEKSTPFVHLLLTNGTPLHNLFRTLHPF